MIKICKYCKREFQVRPSVLKKTKNAGSCCSHICRNKYFVGKNSFMYNIHLTQEHKDKIRQTKIGDKNPNFGKHPTIETRQKMRESHIGNYPSEETKEKISESRIGNKNPFYNKNHTKESRQSMSKNRMGEKNGRWNNGSSYEPYTPEFNKQLKELIRNRDNNICQLCGTIKNGRNLDVHHIDYNKKNCLPNNLITLCRACNAKVNTNRKQWIKFFKNKGR